MTAEQVQIRRDTNANLATATPAAGELAWDTTNKRLAVGDGSTLAGIPHINYLDFQTQKFVYGTTGGTGDVITLTSTKAIAAYAAGLKVAFKAGAANTGAVTMNVDGKGARNVKKLVDGVLTALAADDITSGGVYELYDDGTQFQIKGLNEKTSSDGAMIYLSTFTASASASIDINSVLSSTYDDYVIILNAVRPATDNTKLYLRTSTNNGSSFASAASDYSWKIIGDTVTNAAGDSEIELTGANIDNAAASAISGEIRLYSVNDATAYKKIVSDLAHADGSTPYNNRAIGMRLSTAAINSVQLLMAAGNITSGTFKVYGIAKV